MVELIGMKGLDEAEFISDFLQVGQEVRQLQSGGAAFAEGKLIFFRSPKKIRLFANEGELIGVEELVRA